MSHDPFADYAEIRFNPEVVGSELSERIKELFVQREVRPGGFAHTDYNFTKPKSSLMSTKQDARPHSKAKYEMCDYPGEFGDGPAKGLPTPEKRLESWMSG